MQIQFSTPLSNNPPPLSRAPLAAPRDVPPQTSASEPAKFELAPQGRANPSLTLCEHQAPPAWTPEVKHRLELSLGMAEPSQLQAWARQKLGLEGVALPDAQTRQTQFQTFVQRHFPQRPAHSDEFDSENYGPTPDMPVYQLFEAYAQTDYGALMIQKVLAQAGDKPFVVKAVDGVSPKAWDDIMVVPPDFPKPGARFAAGGQPVDPLAILHHEFEHTRFGRQAQSLEEMLAEEAFTVSEVENPVRILNGFEPRYTYTQLDTSGQPLVTLNIFNPALQRAGAWTFDPQDPRKLIPLR